MPRDDDDDELRCPQCRAIVSRARAIFSLRCPACGGILPPPPGVLEVPPLGDSVTSAIMTKWYVPDGATVQPDQPLCELETEKASADLPSPHAGTLKHLKAEGDTVRPGDRIADIS